jgi:predicted enzyme related to lactoylglutathione lyase
MADVPATPAARPVWIDLSSSDPAGSREFYAAVFGWDIEVTQDPRYGGYAIARLGGLDVAGIGGTQSPDQPTTWNVYIGTPDADGLAVRVAAAGGTVVAPPFDVVDTGRMAVLQDPTGAFISAWQPDTMMGFTATGPGTYQWAELGARGFDSAITFYGTVFGWVPDTMNFPGGLSYTRFVLDGEPIAGGTEMSPMVPAGVPSYWMIYFGVDDVDATFAAVIAAGGREMLSPGDFPGGRFAIVGDPQGATFAFRSTR